MVQTGKSAGYAVHRGWADAREVQIADNLLTEELDKAHKAQFLGLHSRSRNIETPSIRAGHAGIWNAPFQRRLRMREAQGFE